MNALRAVVSRRIARPVRRLAAVAVVGVLTAFGASTSVMAQSASSQVPITVPASVVASIQPAALVVGPTVSVLGAQITTKAPTTIAAEVLGASIVAPSTSVSGVAFTGSDVAGPVRLSLTLGLAGGGLVLIARGRRRPRV